MCNHVLNSNFTKTKSLQVREGFPKYGNFNGICHEGGGVGGGWAMLSKKLLLAEISAFLQVISKLSILKRNAFGNYRKIIGVEKSAFNFI